MVKVSGDRKNHLCSSTPAVFCRRVSRRKKTTAVVFIFAFLSPSFHSLSPKDRPKFGICYSSFIEDAATSYGSSFISCRLACSMLLYVSAWLYVNVWSANGVDIGTFATIYLRKKKRAPDWLRMKNNISIACAAATRRWVVMFTSCRLQTMERH